LSVRPEQTFRDLSWTLKPFWVTDMEYTVRVQDGDVETHIEAIPETMEDQSITVYASYDSIAKEKDDHPAGGGYSFVTQQAQVGKADTRIISGLMGATETLVEGPDPGTCYVRLYGDATQLVIAENRQFKAVYDRPCEVQVNLRADSAGRPIQNAYTVINVRTSGFGGSSWGERGFITRKPVFCVNDPMVENDAAPPLPVMGSSVTALRINVVVVAAGTGITTFVVVVNDVILGTVSLGAGLLYAETILTPLVLADGDILHLNVTAAGGCQKASVTVECREYGL